MTTTATEMKQTPDLTGFSGCKGTDVFFGNEVAREAWGEQAETPGLSAFPYLWRRFGPPWSGSDPYKSIADYHLTTQDPGVVLWITVSGSSIDLGVGALWSKEVDDAIRGPRIKWERDFEDWWLKHEHPEVNEWEDTEENRRKAGEMYWNERMDRSSGVYERAEKLIGKMPEPHCRTDWQQQTGVVHRINSAIFDALKELTKPVMVRDVPINIFGVCDWQEEQASRSDYAGYGCSQEHFDKLLKEGDR